MYWLRPRTEWYRRIAATVELARENRRAAHPSVVSGKAGQNRRSTRPS
ncbi:hypothetical protein [Amycolatopsis sp. CA-128772]|nr:hypothetical protein [Amycolatopsis sp. CA-128772]